MLPYKPVEFSSAHVLENSRPHGQAHADPIDAREAADEIQQRLARSFAGVSIELDENGRPKIPTGRTGTTGRGVLHRWGPNLSACAVVTCSNSAKTISVLVRELSPSASGPSRITHQLPVSFVRSGERISDALARTLLGAAPSEPLGAVCALFKSDGREMFRGLMNDDKRNTDNAWVELVAIHLHLTPDKLKAFPLLQKSRDRWVAVSEISKDGVCLSVIDESLARQSADHCNSAPRAPFAKVVRRRISQSAVRRVLPTDGSSKYTITRRVEVSSQPDSPRELFQQVATEDEPAQHSGNGNDVDSQRSTAASDSPEVQSIVETLETNGQFQKMSQGQSNRIPFERNAPVPHQQQHHAARVNEPYLYKTATAQSWDGVPSLFRSLSLQSDYSIHTAPAGWDQMTPLPDTLTLDQAMALIRRQQEEISHQRKTVASLESSLVNALPNAPQAAVGESSGERRSVEEICGRLVRRISALEEHLRAGQERMAVMQDAQDSYSRMYDELATRYDGGQRRDSRTTTASSPTLSMNHDTVDILEQRLRASEARARALEMERRNLQQSTNNQILKARNKTLARVCRRVVEWQTARRRAHFHRWRESVAHQTIRAARIVGWNWRNCVVFYEIHVESAFAGYSWCVERRYQAFDDLRQHLEPVTLPGFPGKNLRQPLTEPEISKRVNELDTWLRLVVACGVVTNDPNIASFLGCHSSSINPISLSADSDGESAVSQSSSTRDSVNHVTSPSTRTHRRRRHRQSLSRKWVVLDHRGCEVRLTSAESPRIQASPSLAHVQIQKRTNLTDGRGVSSPDTES